MTKAGLQSHKFQCYPIETWLKYLQEHGLLLVGAQAAETSLTTLHMRVVEGIYGFAGEPDGTWTQIMDPGWGGKKYNENFLAFNTKYEGVIDIYGWEVQVAHF
jgi:hypothetical protein